MTLQKQLQANRHEILAIAAKHGASNVRIFSSVARNESTPESDIDFLIDYDLEKNYSLVSGRANSGFRSTITNQSRCCHSRRIKASNP